jgi:transposase-like protein
MSNKAPTLRQFQVRFPTEESCLDHLFQVRYGNAFNCPGCGREAKFSRVKARRSYQCQWCAYQVYPTAGTPFDRTRTPLRDWFFVMFQFCSSHNGVAAKEVERQLGVTYKTAWRMCHMIREYMGKVDGDGPIGGFARQVKIDETSLVAKSSAVIAAEIRPKARPSSSVWSSAAECRHAHDHPQRRHAAYLTIRGEGYFHETVNHRVGQYVSAKGSSIT